MRRAPTHRARGRTKRVAFATTRIKSFCICARASALARSTQPKTCCKASKLRDFQLADWRSARPKNAAAWERAAAAAAVKVGSHRGNKFAVDTRARDASLFIRKTRAQHSRRLSIGCGGGGERLELDCARRRQLLFCFLRLPSIDAAKRQRDEAAERHKRAHNHKSDVEAVCLRFEEG